MRRASRAVVLALLAPAVSSSAIAETPSRDRAFAVIVSFPIPGAGAAYLGQPGRGAAQAIAFYGGLALAGFGASIANPKSKSNPGVVDVGLALSGAAWTWSMIDAASIDDEGRPHREKLEIERPVTPPAPTSSPKMVDRWTPTGGWQSVPAETMATVTIGEHAQSLRLLEPVAVHVRGGATVKGILQSANENGVTVKTAEAVEAIPLAAIDSITQF